MSKRPVVIRRVVKVRSGDIDFYVTEHRQLSFYRKDAHVHTVIESAWEAALFCRMFDGLEMRTARIVRLRSK